MNLESNEKNNSDQKEKNALSDASNALNEHNELIEIKASKIVNKYSMWSWVQVLSPYLFLM